MLCVRRVSGILFTRYAQKSKWWKAKWFKKFWEQDILFKVVPYTSGKIWSARLIFFIFLAVCLNISTVINIKIWTNYNQQTQSYKFTSHIAAFLSVVLITEMLEICILTSYDQNVQLIIKSYLPVMHSTPLNPFFSCFLFGFPIFVIWTTGTCFIQNIYALSSSLLQGKHLPISPSPLRLNIFHLFVILSLTQLYRYTPKMFLFLTATFKYTYTHWKWQDKERIDYE